MPCPGGQLQGLIKRDQGIIPKYENYLNMKTLKNVFTCGNVHGEVFSCDLYYNIIIVLHGGIGFEFHNS